MIIFLFILIYYWAGKPEDRRIITLACALAFGGTLKKSEEQSRKCYQQLSQKAPKTIQNQKVMPPGPQKAKRFQKDPKRAKSNPP